jgi:hypothetical protein
MSFGGTVWAKAVIEVESKISLVVHLKSCIIDLLRGQFFSSARITPYRIKGGKMRSHALTKIIFCPEDHGVLSINHALGI